MATLATKQNASLAAAAAAVASVVSDPSATIPGTSVVEKLAPSDAPGAVVATVSLLPPNPPKQALTTGSKSGSSNGPAEQPLVPGGINPRQHATVLKAQKLLLRLTKALFAYGAPLYRVELRVQACADSLALPLSILTLPNAMVLAFGDGSPHIWPQTYIVKGFQGQNMGKLHDVDKWAKKLMAQCEMAKEAHKLGVPVVTADQIGGKSGMAGKVQEEGRSRMGTATGVVNSPGKDKKSRKVVTPRFEIGGDDSDDAPDEDGMESDGSEVDGEAEQGLIKKKQAKASSEPTGKSKAAPKPGDIVRPQAPGFAMPQKSSAAPKPSDGGTLHELESIADPMSPAITVSPVSPDLPGTPNAPSPSTMVGKRSIEIPKASSATSASTVGSADPAAPTKSLLTLGDPELDWFLNELDRLVHSQKEFPPWLRILCCGLVAMLMLLMLNPASVWDLILTFLLGTLNGILSHMGEVKKINALEVLVPMAIAMVGKICEVFLKDQICFGTITMFACFSYFPGTLMALSMVELASRNLVSGTVRMFYSFVRSVKFGFGLAMGARLIGWLNSHGIPGVEMPKDNIHCMDSTLRPYTADVYKNLGYELLVFIPMALCINVILRAKKSQWLGMAAASVCGLFTLQLASGIFTKDASAALAAFAIGMVAHVQARYKDDLAIANILAGICWLTPGSVGVRGAALLMTDDLKGSTSFALDMIIRAMSVSIGLYVSGLLLFPMVRKSKMSVLSL